MDGNQGQNRSLFICIELLLHFITPRKINAGIKMADYQKNFNMYVKFQTLERLYPFNTEL